MYGYYWEKLHANNFWELKGLISCITPHAHCKELTLPQKYILDKLAFYIKFTFQLLFQVCTSGDRIQSHSTSSGTSSNH